MSYFEYPASISLTFESGTLSLDWSNIKRHTVGFVGGCCTTNSPHVAIGKLMRELGNRAGSSYNNYNWGWDSEGDGWYFGDAFDPGSREFSGVTFMTVNKS